MRTIMVSLSERDAEFAVEHLRLLADANTTQDGTHAAARLTARYVADQIAAKLNNDD